MQRCWKRLSLCLQMLFDRGDDNDDDDGGPSFRMIVVEGFFFYFNLVAFLSFLHCMAFSLQDNGVLTRDLRVMHGRFARYPRFSAGPFCCCCSGNDSFTTYIDQRALDEQQGDGVRHARHIVIIHHV